MPLLFGSAGDNILLNRLRPRRVGLCLPHKVWMFQHFGEGSGPWLRSVLVEVRNAVGLMCMFKIPKHGPEAALSRRFGIRIALSEGFRPWQTPC